jgi:hypothetical protein
MKDYIAAWRLMPGNGHAFNQIALVYEMRQNELMAAYFYMRAMLADKKPYSLGSKNFHALLSRAKIRLGAPFDPCDEFADGTSATGNIERVILCALCDFFLELEGEATAASVGFSMWQHVLLWEKLRRWFLDYLLDPAFFVPEEKFLLRITLLVFALLVVSNGGSDDDRAQFVCRFVETLASASTECLRHPASDEPGTLAFSAADSALAALELFLRWIVFAGPRNQGQDAVTVLWSVATSPASGLRRRLTDMESIVLWRRPPPPDYLFELPEDEEVLGLSLYSPGGSHPLSGITENMSQFINAEGKPDLLAARSQRMHRLIQHFESLKGATGPSCPEADPQTSALAAESDEDDTIVFRPRAATGSCGA